MGVLRDLAYAYLVPLTATKGQCKGHIINELVPLLDRWDSRRVGYIGDHEIRGPADQMENHTRRTIEEHAQRQFIGDEWERIALTQEQVDADSRLAAEVIEKVDN